MVIGLVTVFTLMVLVQYLLRKKGIHGLIFKKGKSSFICALLKEHEFHLKNDDGSGISGIWYIYREEDENIKKLKFEFGKKAYEKLDVRFLKKLDVDLMEMVGKRCVIVLDDQEFELTRSKGLQAMLHSAGSVYAHHKELWIFVLCQSVAVLKKNHKLHSAVSQSTHMIFFRNLLEGKSVCRYLSNLSIKLKGGLSLGDVFERYIQTKLYSYLLILVSPRLSSSKALSNILIDADGPMLRFDDSDGETG